MFGSKKSNKSSPNARGNKDNNMANLMGMGIPMDEDEDSLLAELHQLQGKPPPSKKQSPPKKKLMSMDEIEKMAAHATQDIEDDDDDDDDENDLLAELDELTGENDGEEEEDESNEPSGSNIGALLLERKQVYTTAVGNAKAENAASKVRRLERGLKEIDALIKKQQKGIAIKEDDIPPPVSVVKSKPIDKPPTLPRPPEGSPVVHARPVQPITIQPESPQQAPQTISQKSEPTPQAPEAKSQQASQPSTQADENLVADDTTMQVLLSRQQEYKEAALKCKQQGDVEKTRKYLIVYKKFEFVINEAKAGKTIDLTSMPGPPGEAAPKTTSVPVPQPPVTQPPQQQEAAKGPPSPPTTVLEALSQRLDKYNEAAEQAKTEGNGNKARRMGRIVKQYQDAIKNHKAGKLVDYQELPTPPGFGPIPGVTVVDHTEEVIQSASAPGPTPAPASTATPSPATAGSSRNAKELEFLRTRQRQFKMAAVKAKQSGNIEEARDYLRKAKGMENMITNAENGLRVDVTTVPAFPSTSGTPSTSDDSPSASSMEREFVEIPGDAREQYLSIEHSLRKQIEAAEKNEQHYKLLGNLEAAKNFGTLLQSSKKDLNTLLQHKKLGRAVPKCEYQEKSFAVVRSNPQLSDSELEITVVRCTNVPLPSGYQPKDMYSYVTYEFPYPQEQPQTGHTSTKKETINPEFNESFRINIDRKNRSFMRVTKRQGLTLKLIQVRGFLKGNKPLGQATIKLENFSNKCEIHQAVDLMDTEKGRKSVGGKIEVMLKIREPLVDKDAEIVKEKWLVLDTHLRGLELKTPQEVPKQGLVSPTYESLEVLKFEKDLLETQRAAYKSQGRSPPAPCQQRIQNCQQKMQDLQAKLKKGGRSAIDEYLQGLTRGLDIEKIKASNALKKGDKDAAKRCLQKRKLIEKEIGILQQRLQSS